MRTITTQEMAEPNVEYIVPDGLELPEKVTKYLAFCIYTPVTNTTTGQRGRRYCIPAYMMREWLAGINQQR